MNWFESNPQEEESAVEQLSLLDNSEALVERQRVDGALIRKRYTQTIREKGGSEKVYAKATETLTQNVMGCGTRELYQRTGAKRNRRETLPVTAQEALMGAEIVANHDLKRREIEGDGEERDWLRQAPKDRQIVEAARESGQNWRKLLPW